MSYNRLNLKTGDKLTSAHMQHIEDGINNAHTTINTETNTNIQLVDNIEFRRGIIATLNISLPETLNDDFVSSVVFTSGSSATAVTLPGGIIIQGDNNSFTANANTRYNLLFWYDGSYVWCGINSAAI